MGGRIDEAERVWTRWKFASAYSANWYTLDSSFDRVYESAHIALLCIGSKIIQNIMLN